MQYQKLTTDNESEQKINVKKTTGNLEINLQNTIGADTETVSIKQTKQENGNMMDKNSSITYEDDKN